MARKRTKGEALERLAEARSLSGRAPLKGKAKMVHDAAYLGAAGLIMLDPLNRLADGPTIVPYDMIAIPAHEYYRLDSNPSFQIYIRGGESILPTGGNVDDVAEGIMELEEIHEHTVTTQKRKPNAYQRKYKAAFKSIAPKYKLKNGKWKKGGFKAAVRAAHKKAGGKK